MKKKEGESRRSYLKHVLAGTVGVAGAATIARPVKTNSATGHNQQDETLYHENESFKKYYKTLCS